MISVNGIAHIQLTVRDVERSRPFYRWLLHDMFGMTVQ
jgi:catechol 2,3-dioxygenase-like lactoylglutathione lyase family enzyme